MVTRDDLGYEVELPQPVQRVVSLVPSLTEALAESVPQLLVGCTDWCVRPADIERRAGHEVVRVRGTKNPDREAIAALHPDLVIANQEENRRFDVDKLRDAGVPVWVTSIDTVDQALSSLGRLFDQALGVAPPDWLVQARNNWLEPDPPITRTAIVCIWRDPWMVIGPDTYAADVLHRSCVGLAPLPIEDWQHARYPKLELDALKASGADLVLLMDAPYSFTPSDGPECFPGMDVRIVPERPLAWYGPALADARAQIQQLVG